MSQKNTKTLQVPYICVIGGSNIDIVGYPNSGELLIGDSNPGMVKTSLGGVGRNIAENLARLGVATKLLSVVGDDAQGRRILDHAKAIGLDMEAALITDAPTSTYLCVLDEAREMHVGIAHMDILQQMDIIYIQKHADLIQNALFCVVDTNLPEILSYLVIHFTVPFVLDTVSANKAARARHLLGHLHTVKANRLEAEILSGITIQSETDLQKAGRYFMMQGIKNSIITLGTEGVYFKTPESEGVIRTASVDMVSASGAGDALMAGLVYGLVQGVPWVESVRFAMGASLMAIRSEESIHPDLSPERVEAVINRLDFHYQKL